MTKFIDRKSVFKALFAFLFLVVGCNSTDKTEKNITFEKSAAKDQGTLLLVANGEDFVRQGFTSKDGWEIDFTKLTVSVANVVAYQTKASFDADKDQGIKSKLAIPLIKEIKVIDLTQKSVPGNSTPPSLTSQDLTIVKKVTVPLGSYRAISWEMLPKNEAEAQTIFLQGSAVNNGKKINFELGLLLPMKYLCGEFIGETRKGTVTEEQSAELEMTFHFDHLFGDGTAPAEDAINRDALGFQPLAELAQAGSLNIGWQELQQKLEPTDLDNLSKAIAGLGHVGEGHCKVIQL